MNTFLLVRSVVCIPAGVNLFCLKFPIFVLPHYVRSISHLITFAGLKQSQGRIWFKVFENKILGQ